MSDGCRRPLAHIGFHKTGTTWIQRNVLRRPGMGFEELCDTRWFVHNIGLPAPFTFDVAATRRRLETALRAIHGGQVPFVSHERLSGMPDSGGYDSETIAHRIASALPTARILITVREQRSVILSAYRQYVADGGTSSLRRYVCSPKIGFGRIPLFDFDFYQYHRIIQRYIDLFGADSVCVLPFEWLRLDAKKFVPKLLDFAGAEPDEEAANDATTARAANVGLSGLACAVKRRVNEIIIRDTLNPNGLFEVRGLNRGILTLTRWADIHLVPSSVRELSDRRLRHFVDSVVGDRYRSSNTETSRLAQLDLAELGYAVE